MQQLVQQAITSLLLQTQARPATCAAHWQRVTHLAVISVVIAWLWQQVETSPLFSHCVAIAEGSYSTSL
jgi:hypothetical protein